MAYLNHIYRNLVIFIDFGDFFFQKIIEFVTENVQKFATVQKFPTQKRLISLVVFGRRGPRGGEIPGGGM
jgi:hypothetical protein